MFGPIRGTVASITEALDAAKLTSPESAAVLDAAKAALATECASPHITDVRVSVTSQPVTTDLGCGAPGCTAKANPCLNHPTTPRLTETGISESMVIETVSRIQL